MASATTGLQQAAPLSFEDLPFVHLSGENCWHVPPAPTLPEAAQRGREFAAYFAQYLKGSPELAGKAQSLSYIVMDMEFLPDGQPGSRHQCALGFMAYLERLILLGAQQVDLLADVAAINAAERSAAWAERLASTQVPIGA